LADLNNINLDNINLDSFNLDNLNLDNINLDNINLDSLMSGSGSSGSGSSRRSGDNFFESLWEGITGGSTPGMIFDIGSRALGGKIRPYQPKTFWEKMGYNIGGIGTDLAIAGMTGGLSIPGQIISKAGVRLGASTIGKQLAKQGAKQIGREAAKKQGLKWSLGLLNKNILKQEGKNLFKKNLLKEIGSQATEQAIFGAGLETIRSPLRQIRDENKLDFGTTAADIAGGAAGGAVGGAVFAPLTLLGKISGAKSALLSKGTSLNKIYYGKAADSLRKEMSFVDDLASRANLTKKADKELSLIAKTKNKIKDIAEEPKLELGEEYVKSQNKTLTKLNKKVDGLQKSVTKKLKKLGVENPSGLEQIKNNIKSDNEIIRNYTWLNDVAIKVNKLGLSKSELNKINKAFTKEIKSQSNKFGFNVNAKEISELRKIGTNATEMFNIISNKTGNQKISELVNNGYHYSIEGKSSIKKIIQHPFYNKLKKDANFAKAWSEAYKKNINGLKVSEQEMALLQEGKKFFDLGREIQIANGAKIGLRDDYFIPLRLKGGTKGGKTTVNMFRRKIKEGLLPSEKEYFSKEQMNLLELDPQELTNRYVREIGRSSLNKKLIPEVVDASSDLRLRGFNDYADIVEEWGRNSLGMDKVSFRKMSVDDLVEKSIESVENTLREFTAKTGKRVGDKVATELYDLMYHSYVGTNPLTIFVKQPLQNLLTASAELGVPSVLRGRAATLGGKYKGVINSVKNRLYNLDMNFLEELGNSNVSSKIGKAIKLPGKPGMWLFGKLHKDNVNTAFLSAYLKMKDKGFKGFSDKIMESLLDSQKQSVMNSFRRGGIEAAAKEFGVTTAHRANFLYSIFDKPLYFQRGLARYLPFTTWGRNQLNRVVEAYGTDGLVGGTKSLAKRIAYPTAVLATIAKLTGRDINKQTMQPLNTIVGLGEAGVTPFIAPISEGFRTGKPLKGLQRAARIIPGYNVYKKAQNIAKKGAIEGGLMLEPLKK
jgi:hypothetical protein